MYTLITIDIFVAMNSLQNAANPQAEKFVNVVQKFEVVNEGEADKRSVLLNLLSSIQVFKIISY